MSDWRDQEATNQTIFREFNEWIQEQNDQLPEAARLFDVYLCECSDRQCTEPISLTRPEYEAIRADPVRFGIVVNHENPEIDRVIVENHRYAIVEKFYGSPARIARDSDPRR